MLHGHPCLSVIKVVRQFICRKKYSIYDLRITSHKEQATDKMRAVILAGGKGTRLKPYTTVIPKPLVPIGDEMPIMEIVVRQLASAGFTHLTIAVNHLAELIESFFGNGSKWNVKIDYSYEDKPLSTIGPLTLIKDLPENFLVMNGDLLCDMDYREFYDYHVKMKNSITISAFKRTAQIDFGVLKYNSDQILTEFIEKPVYDFSVSMGIYCFSRSVIEKIPEGSVYGFDQLMVDSIKNNEQVHVKPFEGFWLDIGRLEDYETANEKYEEIKTRIGL